MSELNMNKPSFKKVGKDEKHAEKILRPSTTFMQDAWYRFKKNKLGLFGAIIIIFMILFAVFGPYLCKYDYITQNLKEAYLSPNAEHIFGTDNLGRDVLVRMCYGARISLACGFVASIISVVIGVTYGAISGFIGGTVDNIMMRIVDIISAIPSMLYVILLMVVLGNSLTNVFLVIGLTGWLGMARLVRGQVMSLKEREYVLAARTLGAKDFFIIFKEILPNIFGQIIVESMFSIPNAIFMEAYLSFVGLGVPAPLASLGSLISDGYKSMITYPHMLMIPVIVLALLMLSFNLFADGLRDAFDPKMNR